MPPSDASAVEAEFERIADALAAGDFKKSLRNADAVLSSMLDDEDALRAKLFSLIMLARYQDALALADSKASVLPDTAYERAYCLWKLDRIQEALETVQRLETPPALHLKGLLHLRLSDGRAALDAYQRLIPAIRSDKVAMTELGPNVVAAHLMAGESSDVEASLRQMGLTSHDSFEVAFNVACVALAAGRTDDAQHLLEFADTHGQEVLLEDNLGPSEVDRELAVVRAQLAHVLSLRGEVEECGDRYAAVLALNLEGDVATAALATSNASALRVLAHRSDAVPSKLLKDTLKKLSGHMIPGAAPALQPALASRLSAAQAAALFNNAAVFSLLSARVSPGKASAADCVAAALLAVASVGLLRDAEEGIAAAEAWLEAHPQAPSVRITLLAAHVAAASTPPHAQRAVQLLRSPRLPESTRFAPALVATRAALLEGTGDAAATREELEASLAWWEAAPAGDERGRACAWCLDRLGALCLKLGDSSRAVECFKKLETVSGAGSAMPADVLAKLARSLAAVDPAAVPPLQSRLRASAPHVDRDALAEAEELDLSYVRSKGSSLLLEVGSKSTGKRAIDDETGDATKRSGPQRKKRKRKPRYPKGFDPAKPGPAPDPERWLPRHERAEFKKRRKRSQKNQPVAKGAQGMGKVDESLDKSGLTADMLDTRAASSAGPRLPGRSAPKGSQAKRKGRR